MSSFIFIKKKPTMSIRLILPRCCSNIPSQMYVLIDADRIQKQKFGQRSWIQLIYIRLWYLRWSIYKWYIIYNVNYNHHLYFNLQLGFPSVRIEPGPYSVEYGQDITLVCNITSNPRHFNVYWSRELNGVSRTTHYGINITLSTEIDIF